MAQVPYQSYPTAVPEGATPTIGVQTPPAAFGATVAEALQGAGVKIEHGGDEIFARAMQIQDLQNRTEVDKADANFMEQAGLAHAKFNALQGANASPQALAAHIQELKAIRENIKGGLSNPMSQKMFDSTSLSTLGRTIFNAAGVAASQTKAAAIDAVTQRLSTTIDTGANSDDPDAVEAARDKAKGLNYQLHQLKGTQESIPDGEHQINSSLDTNVILQKAKTDPFTAAKMLEEKRGGLTQQDYNSADKFITSQRRAIGSVNIANQVYKDGSGDDGKPELSLEEMQLRARALAAKAAPDDPMLGAHAVAALDTRYNQAKAAGRQFKWDNQQEIATSIQNGATNIQQILADPKAAAAYHSLDPKEQNQIPGQINRYIAARDQQANQAKLTQIVGLRNNDFEAFLNLDPTKEGLSQPQIRQVMEWQAQDKKRQNDDPRVNRAMTWLRGAMGSQLQALDVHHRTDKNKDDYDHLTGALQSSLDAWQESHNGKPPNYEEVTTKIGPQLIQQTTVPGWLWGTNKVPFFNQPTPDDFTDATKKEFKEGNKPEPEPEYINKLYVRSQLQRFYGKATPTQ